MDCLYYDRSYHKPTTVLQMTNAEAFIDSLEQVYKIDFEIIAQR